MGSREMVMQADVTVMLRNAGHLGDVDYETAFNRVRSWQKRGKLPPPDATRPNGQPLWDRANIAKWIEAL